MLSKIPASNENMSDVARTLSGLVRSDPRADPMEGELDFMRGLMTYDLANQNEGCLNIDQMQPGMIGRLQRVSRMQMIPHEEPGEC